MKKYSREFLKRYLPYLGVVLLFVGIATAYFVPATFEGRVLFQADGAGASGTAQDVRDFMEETGERSYWTNSLFGGMPMYQISPTFPSALVLKDVSKVYSLQAPLKLLGDYPWLLFVMMLGFFLLLKSLDLGTWFSALGAIVWCFSSYFIILIVAGHIWKLMALAYIPPTIAGLIWIYRGKFLRGSFLFALFTALQLQANHFQMTYYFLFVMIALVLGWGIEAIQQKKTKHFFKATSIALLAGLLGIATNTSKLYHTYTYAQETNRGGSELVSEENSSSSQSKGFDKEYITQWSYGIPESLSLFVPNIRGGASEAIGKDISLLKSTPVMYRNSIAGLSAYWGEQPFTSGPVYVGAFVFILFLLGCVLVKGAVKWSLLSVTILALFLSWGHNFMPLTDFFIDYIPMYGKFRAVSSILVIVEFTIPVLAILGLVEILRDSDRLFKNKKLLIGAIGLPMLLVFLMAITPSFFGSGLTHHEEEMFRTLTLQTPSYIGLQDALVAIRLGMLSADAWRSLIILFVSLCVLFLFHRGKLQKPFVLLLIAVVSFFDLWFVDRRYLNDEHFLPAERVEQMASPKTTADEAILRDKTLGFRVWNQCVNSFNDATTSRWHRSIGGYHAAKLQRYQDIIEHQLMKGNEQVVNMLNTHYLIIPNQRTGQPEAVYNAGAFGAAWFVNNIKSVHSPQEEMNALNSEDLRHTAILNTKTYAEALPLLEGEDCESFIEPIEYLPNKITYKCQTTGLNLAVFSEIYYPHGWYAEIDGQPTDILRVNYILRAVFVPKGEHTITFRFEPTSIKVTEWIARLAIVLLFLLLGILITKEIITRTRNKKAL